jgi:hypothetical protein
VAAAIAAWPDGEDGPSTGASSSSAVSVGRACRLSSIRLVTNGVPVRLVSCMS